eukprot:CAMPEP_0181021748 /NCGR_PEP_ID=MMETSP1070-20121207/1145_1 /TAXON_ID=265543 /ORGANISM="Minutocellus polymorphus, Strain NH13" /LENGTH=549 /DNA_ID=CAMNT_0023098641 /DNA_START=189 /DNA_END=1838 /DNA_ORIENTATION=-
MNDKNAAKQPAAAIMALPAPEPTTATYRHQAVRMLQNHFRGVACITIAFVFAQHNFQFTAAFHVLTEIHDKDEAVLQRIEASQPGLKIFIKTERKAKSVRITDPSLLDDIEGIPELNRKKGPAAAAAAEDDDISIIDLLDDCSLGSANDDAGLMKQIECGCCFGEFSPEKMEECSAGHHAKVCRDCIKRFVTEQLDGQNRTEFNCIVDSDCGGSYSMFQLSKILSPKTNDRLNDRRIRAEIEASGMIAWTCMQCNHVGFLGEEPLPASVWCSSDQCRLVQYCRLCKYPWHQGQTCQESATERERLKDPVLRAQEAMTAVTVRKCPQCATPFEKLDGCNKMTCSKCRCISCYLCKQPIEGYAHFCNKHDCKCNKCHLWANPDENDKRARNEAGRKILVDAKMSDADIKRVLASTCSPPRQRPAAAAAAAGGALNQQPEIVLAPGQAPARAGPQQAVAAAAAAAVAPPDINLAEDYLADFQRRQLQFDARIDGYRRQAEAMQAEYQRQAEARRRRAEVEDQRMQQQLDAIEDPLARLNYLMARIMARNDDA